MCAFIFYITLYSQYTIMLPNKCYAYSLNVHRNFSNLTYTHILRTRSGFEWYIWRKISSTDMCPPLTICLKNHHISDKTKTSRYCCSKYMVKYSLCTMYPGYTFSVKQILFTIQFYGLQDNLYQ